MENTEALRTVNLTELASVLGMSDNALRALIRNNPEFPVLSRGSSGVPYEFDIDAVIAWRQEHEAAILAAEEARNNQLDLLRAEIYGPSSENEPKGLTPDQRRKLADATRMEDYNRVRRKGLLERAPLKAILSAVWVEHQRTLRQLPIEFARRVGLESEDRGILKEMVDEKLHKMSREFGEQLSEKVNELLAA